MSNGRNKVCPRCGSIAALNATECRQCGREFRTTFAGSSGAAVSRKAAGGSSRNSARGKKVGLSTSLLPSEFHRPSDEHPEFAAPTGMPPTYHDLPNIEVLRKDLGESLSRIGAPNSEPFSQLFLADAPGSPLAFDPPELPDLMPFHSTAGPQLLDSSQTLTDLPDHRIDWTNPSTFLGFGSGSNTALAEQPVNSSAFVQPEPVALDSTVYNRAVTDFSLNVRPIMAPGLEVEVEERDFLSAKDLLPYDKAVQPVNKWYRYALNAVLIGCGISILTSSADYLHIKPTNVFSQMMVALSPAKKSPNVAVPSEDASDVVVDKDGDFLKPVTIVKPNRIKGLDPSVFSQLSQGNSTVGVVDAAPQNVAVLPINGTAVPADEDGMSKSSSDSLTGNEAKGPQPFSQTAFPVIQFKLHTRRDHRQIL